MRLKLQFKYLATCLMIFALSTPLLAKSNVLTIVGAQWGDESKGAITDLLSKDAKIIVRFNGGNNAGHTIVSNGKTYKLHAIPSGIIRSGTVNYIGSGCVLDLEGFFQEIAVLKKQGLKVGPKNLRIASNTPLVLPLHKELDGIREANAGKTSIGTTKKGIGPAYEDKVGRRSIRAIDLIGLSKKSRLRTLEAKVDKIISHHNALRRGLKQPLVNKKEVMTHLTSYAKKITPYVSEVWQDLDQHNKAGEKILFEAGQGVLLDIDYGTYPYVTSSNTIGTAVSVGSGMGVNKNYVLGVTKAYTTRVGNGPFPTALKNKVGDEIAKIGKEWGVTTGRRRDCGWLDLVALKQAATISNFSALALAKVDVLDNFREVKMCVGYKINGKKYSYLPADLSSLDSIEPIYKTFPGWKGSKGVTSYHQLHENLKTFIRYIEHYVGIPVTIISTGPERENKIILTHPYEA